MLAKFFRALGDPTRLALLEFLVHQEHTVGECVQTGRAEPRARLGASGLPGGLRLRHGPQGRPPYVLPGRGLEGRGPRAARPFFGC